MPESPLDRPGGPTAARDRTNPELGRLPLDSDEVARRPVHLRPAFVVLVAAGGTAGTAVREAIALAVPQPPGIAVLGINVVGAFLLGLLLDALAVTTVLLGGAGVLHALATLLLGGAASFAGIACGALTRSRS